MPVAEGFAVAGERCRIRRGGGRGISLSIAISVCGFRRDSCSSRPGSSGFYSNAVLSDVRGCATRCGPAMESCGCQQTR